MWLVVVVLVIVGGGGGDGGWWSIVSFARTKASTAIVGVGFILDGAGRLMGERRFDLMTPQLRNSNVHPSWAEHKLQPGWIQAWSKGISL